MKPGIAVAAAVCALASPAQARDWGALIDRLQGAVWLHYELTGLHEVADTAATAPQLRELVLAGARLHGVFGTSERVMYHVGFDLAAGATLRGSGVAYDTAVFPVGVATRLGATSILALGAGIGASGATGTLDDALTFPIELTGEVGGGRVRGLVRARATYLVAARARRDGSPSLGAADELEATLGLRIGRHEDAYRFSSGNGYFVAAAYRELQGARFVGLTIGYSIDLATARYGGGHARGGERAPGGPARESNLAREP